MMEQTFPDERFQFLESLFRLAREAGDEGRPQRHIRDLVQDLVEKLFRESVGWTAHGFKDIFVDVLQRQIDVFADLLLPCYHVDKLVAYRRGIEILEPDPV